MSLADHSSESSDDSNKNKDEHSKDDQEENSGTDENKEETDGSDTESDSDGGHDEEVKENKSAEKPTEATKKGEKNKDKNKPHDYDDYDESGLNIGDIDKMFGDQATEKPSSDDNTPKTTVEPPFNLLETIIGGNSGSKSNESATTSSPVEPTETPKEGSEEGQSECQGTHANPFYPYPRPVDVWDRLFVLAAFPICFFAVMLKAEMFR